MIFIEIISGIIECFVYLLFDTSKKEKEDKNHMIQRNTD
jgi:hypothetical protein